MELTFHSVDSEGNKAIYRTSYTCNGSTYTFSDKTQPNTTIALGIYKDTVEFKRSGDVQMEMSFSLHQMTKGKYENALGLRFDLQVKTKELLQEKNKLFIEYDLYVMGDMVSSHKIWVLFH